AQSGQALRRPGPQADPDRTRGPSGSRRHDGANPRARHARAERGGSRKTLSESTGISLPQICRIIKTGKEVTLKNLDKICRTLNTAPNYLMYGIEPTSLYGIHTTKLMATYNQDCFISVVDTTENI
ncbi:MAG: helix-turn-helix domain-containing protein, partial [Bacteroidetes bacterium]|nr:helix-turn-helix domain-containing protein [Bacteroidota bacterium]